MGLANPLLLQDGNYLTLQSGDALFLQSVDKGVTIENLGATTDVPVNYEIDQRSGFRYKPGILIKEDYTGLWVHPDNSEIRHPQTRVRSRPEHQKGALNPEQEDNFISTAITQDDL